jgi:hypothetical protein
VEIEFWRRLQGQRRCVRNLIDEMCVTIQDGGWANDHHSVTKLHHRSSVTGI